MNPVQIETGEFDEAIQIEEDFPAESKCTGPPHMHTNAPTLKHTHTQSHVLPFLSAGSADSSPEFELFAG